MKREKSLKGQPTPPSSQNEGYAHIDFHQTPVLNNGSTLYTPPQTHAGPQYSYGDPEQYETPHDHGFLRQDPYYRDAGYRTPPLPIGENTMLTRSGRAIGSPITTASSLSSRTSASPRSKRNKKGKDNGTKFVLNNPLSVETKDYDVPVRDMMVWARRSHDERRREVSSQHKGNIPRPLNSFMLYRQAYKERIKKWGEQGNNNQLISRVAGESWNMEPPEIKEHYAKVSLVERDNHAAAFPEYKFAPNKTNKKRSREEDEDESDADWDCGSAYSNKRRRGRSETAMVRSRSSTPAHMVYSSPQYHPSSFQASNPHSTPPMPTYQRWTQPVQYDQFYGYGPISYQEPMQDLQYAPTSVPAPHEQYMHLVGMPPAHDGSMDGIGQMQGEYAIDPNLNEFEAPTSYQYGVFSGAEAHRCHEEEHEHVSHPGMQTLAPAEPMWSPDGHAGSAFDAELTQWHGET